MHPLSFIHSCLTKSDPRRNKAFLLALFAMTTCFAVTAQQKKDKRLQLADQYFAAGDYFTAAGLYEQFLHPTQEVKEPTGFPLNSRKNRSGQMGGKVNRLDILYKQAESYRLANYWPQASSRYKECFEKDSARFAAGLYWYAACMRSMGKYAQAELSARESIRSGSLDPAMQAAAIGELSTLEFIRNQIARPDSILYRVEKINTSFATEKGVFAPIALGNNRYLITSTQKDSVIRNGVNPYHNRLYYASLKNGRMEMLEQISFEETDPAFNQATATLGNQGNVLYFTQWKKEDGKNLSSIYYSNKKANGWSQPQLLGSINLEGYSSKQPYCSADGNIIFFSSDRPGGLGQFDIWYAHILEDGTTSEPVNAGPSINSAGNEQSPFFHRNSMSLVFSSDRKPSMGGFDLYSATGEGNNWSAAENLGHPVNSSRDDLYFHASQENDLLEDAIVTSDRGSDCCLETYIVNKTPKKKLITGIIRDCRNNEPLENVEVIMKNKDGRSWQMATREDGRYEFEWNGDTNQQIYLSREGFKDNTHPLGIISTNDQGWLIDSFTNAELCMEKKLVIKPETVVTLYFDYDKSNLKDRATTQLDSIYNVLVENPNATLQISGFTDGRGTVEYNKILSDKRARCCADYLISRGVDSTRITFESFGACCPVEMEMINGRDNADGRSKNRRALINITKD
jgi:OOP family OmpA-OmpF porin